MRVIIDDEPIDAEWLETQGWEFNQRQGFWVSGCRRLLWADEEICVGQFPTTIKTLGELRTFLAFFGDASQ